MHQALLIPELLPEIFKFLHVSLSEKTTFGPHSIWYAVPISRKSLAALARTCKAFHEPAMDLLWSEIEVLESLLGCVPRLHPLIYCDGRMVTVGLAVCTFFQSPLPSCITFRD
ncbi:hypothetical protein BDR04DRAFT_65333 [Suillus decipiens]|nr:hypothetical protein BDR04DRAFT_65333 [Suillus decipiens]